MPGALASYFRTIRRSRNHVARQQQRGNRYESERVMAASMMNRIRKGISLAVVAALLMLCYGAAMGGAITATLGNASPGFASGSVPSVFPDIVLSQGGQPAPFDQGIGNEIIGPDGAASWTFGYSPTGNPITAAVLSIGIADHDSQATGNQVASFTEGGVDLTSALNALFEASGGADGEYDVYQLTLPASVFGDLAGGSPTFNLALQGPGLMTALDGTLSESQFNGFFLIYSQVDIATQDQPPTVPEPNTLALLSLELLGAFGFAWRRRRHARPSR